MASENWMNGIPNKPKKILIVSGQAGEAYKWVNLLEENNYQTKFVKDLHQARETSPEWMPDLIVLDLTQPFEEMLWFCKDIRRFCLCPILIFTTEYNEQQVLDFYGAGVNECMPRPSNPAILLARVRIWLNPTLLFFTAKLTDLQIGGIKLCANENLVLLPDNSKVPLTNLEFRLLHLLMSRPGFVFESQRIVNLVWGISSKEDTSIVKHVIYRLRRKIEPDPANPHYIRSAPNGGYIFYSSEEAGNAFPAPLS